MPRRVRITVFLDDEEYEILRACVPRGMTPSQTLRAAAFDKLTWNYENHKRYRPLTETQWQQRVKQPLQGAPHPQPHSADDGPTFVPEEEQ